MHFDLRHQTHPLFLCYIHGYDGMREMWHAQMSLAFLFFAQRHMLLTVTAMLNLRVYVMENYQTAGSRKS
jgi:hypothetical protein